MENLTHLALRKPPEFLFCAVEGEFVDRTFKRGLNRLKMPFIVLCTSQTDAMRRIPLKKHPTLFVVMSGLMHEDGYSFAQAETGEWVTETIPSKYLRIG